MSLGFPLPGEETVPDLPDPYRITKAPAFGGGSLTGQNGFASVTRPSFEFPSFDFEFTNPFAPPPPSKRAGPIERFFVDQPGLMDALAKAQFAPDALAGVLKLAPGGRALGDILGGIGREVEKVPVLGGVGGFLSEQAKETVTGIMRRILQTAEEFPRTFESEDAPEFIRNVLTLPQRIGATAALGRTGGKLARGELDFSELPEDIRDTLSVVGLIPAMKGAGLIGKAAEGTGFGAGVAGVLKGFATSLRGPQWTSTAAENAGRWAGRKVLQGYGLGLGVEAVVPKIAGDSWWGKEIMENRILPEDHAWRFPVDLAMSLPLDLIALKGALARSKQMAWASQKVYGAPLTAMERKFPNLKNSLGTTISEESVHYHNRAALENRAALGFAQELNSILPEKEQIGRFDWERIASMRGESNFEFKLAVKDEVDRLMQRLGPDEYWAQATETIDEWAGLKGLSPSAALRQMEDYTPWAIQVEKAFPDRILGVEDFHRERQLGPAIRYLEDLPEWGPAEKTRFKSLYFSLAENVTDTGTKAELLAVLKKADAPGVPAFDPAMEARLAQETTLTAAQRAEAAAPLDSLDVFGGRTLAERLAGTVGRAADAVVGPRQAGPVVLSTPPVKLGSLQLELDGLDKRIYGGEKGLGSALAKVRAEMNALRAKVADGYDMKVKSLTRELADTRHELLTTKNLDDLGTAALRERMELLDQEISRATVGYYNAMLTGSRWTVKRQPAGPVMKVTEAIYEKPIPLSERTRLGRVHDALFGGVSGAQLGMEARTFVQDELIQKNSEQAIKDLFDKFHARIQENVVELRGQRFAQTPTVWNLSPGTVNAIGKELGIKVPSEYKHLSEIMFRAHPGPFNILAAQFGKTLPSLPYSTKYHHLTRSWYGTFRFLYDPRFIALNFGEGDIIRVGSARLGAEGAVSSATLQRMTRYLERAQKEALDTGALEVSGRTKSMAMYAITRRPEEMRQVITDAVRRHPAMDDLLKKEGIKTEEQFLDLMDRVRNERERLFTDVRTATAAEAELARDLEKAIDGMELQTGGSLTNARARVEDLRKELREAIREREIRTLAKEQGWKPELQPMLDAMISKDAELLDAAYQTFRGNPNRSAVERAMNSFLLFWPLSYQIKASKLLAEFMFSRGLGYRTGSAGAQTWLEFRQQHDQLLQEDPEYAKFFKDNRELLFVLGNFLPITPEDLGVSLSPLLRAPIRILKGESPSKLWESLTNQGALYTYKLGADIVREQFKQGGGAAGFDDIFERE